MRLFLRLFILLIVFLLGACNLPVTEKNDVLQTPTAARVTASRTLTPRPPTATPTRELPAIYFSDDTNCRTGPGLRFNKVTVIKKGEVAQIAGEPDQREYWVVKNPNGDGTCWVVRDFATPSGVISGIPTIISPSTPTPMPPPADPSLTSWDFSCSYASLEQTTASVTIELIWKDASDFELGYNVYRNDILLASLPQNSGNFTDNVYLGAGETVTYYVEAWNYDGLAYSREVRAKCK